MVLIQNFGKEPFPIGETAPGFIELPATDGQFYTSTDFKSDKALVVIFSCNHCPYAVAYEDRLIALAHQYQPQGVDFVMISANDADNYPADGFEAMQQRAQDKQFPFVYLYDENQHVAQAFRAICTPHVFVIQNQVLAYSGRIDDNWRDPAAVQQADLQLALEALLTGQAIADPITSPMGCSIKWKWDQVGS